MLQEWIQKKITALWHKIFQKNVTIYNFVPFIILKGDLYKAYAETMPRFSLYSGLRLYAPKLPPSGQC